MRPTNPMFLGQIGGKPAHPVIDIGQGQHSADRQPGGQVGLDCDQAAAARLAFGRRDLDKALPDVAFGQPVNLGRAQTGEVADGQGAADVQVIAAGEGHDLADLIGCVIGARDRT